MTILDMNFCTAPPERMSTDLSGKEITSTEYFCVQQHFSGKEDIPVFNIVKVAMRDGSGFGMFSLSMLKLNSNYISLKFTFTLCDLQQPNACTCSRFRRICIN